MDPPRHACRGRPMVCPGPCNPLKAHHHHHHHHHRRHHRQKSDMTEIGMPEPNISSPDEFSQIMLRSLKAESFVTSATSTGNTSISKTSSSTRITLIKIPKIPRPKDTDVPADVIIQQILSPKKLREPPKPITEKTGASKVLRKVKQPKTTNTTSRPEETAVTTPDQAPRSLNNVTCAIMTRLKKLTSKKAPPVFLCLTILLIYAGILVLLAVIAGRTPAYQFFVSSQICGVLAFLMWRLTGTILIWAARIDNTSR